MEASYHFVGIASACGAMDRAATNSGMTLPCSVVFARAPALLTLAVDCEGTVLARS
jgi:hypothetical protein